jgi:hypothetical protein
MSEVTVVVTEEVVEIYDVGMQGPKGDSGGAWGEITGDIAQQTDLQLALAAKQNQFATFSATSGTYETELEQSTTLAIGEDLLYRVRNDGIALTRGQLVYASNAAGHRVIVKPANAAVAGQAAGTLGFVTSSLQTNVDGYALSRGVLGDMNTTVDSEGNSLAIGDLLWLSASVTGGFTKVRPVAARRVGSVLDVHPNQGKILVELPSAMSIDENYDVEVTSPVNGEILVYNNGVFKNARVAPTTFEWDDIVIQGYNLGTGASAPDLINFTPIASMQIHGFDGGTTSEQVFAQVEIPHDWAEGTEIRPHIHWTPTNASAGNVKWFMDYTIADVDGVFSGSQTLSVVDAADGVAWKNQVAALGTINMTGYNISAHIIMRIYRNPADAQDTYGSDAGLLTIGIHYQKDTFGSKLEFIK